MVTETTTNQSQLLAPQTGATFAPGSSSQSQVITVSPSTTYQTMTEFGASFTDSSAWLVYNSPLRNQIMTKLFDPNQGIGLDFLRQPIGASDFSQSLFSYDDMPAGQTDPTLADFSIAHDQAYIIPILQQALSINPSTTIMATPWSPPGWMKTSGSMIGGTLNTADYQVFANYLVKFIQAYDAAGVPISLISPQNEPEYSPSNYPGSTFTSTQEANFIADNLGPAMKAAGLTTGILAYDHNWNDPSFPETVLGDSSAAQYVTGVAWHCYAGDPSAQSTVEALYPSYGTLNPSGGPSMNCTTCTALVTVDNSADTATYNAEYYSLGQVSKFVKPGAMRIGSNTFGSGNIEDVAFQNPDGSDALVVLNSNTSSANTFGVDENGQYFNYTLPAGAVATFTWTPGSTSSGGGGISSGTWYQVVNTNSGDCVDDTGGSTSNGTAVQQWACGSGNANQEWQFQPTSGGYYQVATRNNASEVWDVTGGTSATGNGTLIQLWSATGGTNQQWLPTLQSNGTYTFTARNSSNECLDVTNRSTTNGTQLQQWACTVGDTAQTFQLVPVS